MPTIKLNVPFYSQNDNLYWADDLSEASGSVQCCPTANTMLLAYKIPDFLSIAQTEGHQEPECLYKQSFLAQGWSVADRGNHDAHTSTLNAWGLKTEWRTDLTDVDVKRSLASDFPVVAGFEYKEAGHICVIVGRSDNGYFIHDPNGIRDGANDRYLENSGDGRDRVGALDFYSWRTLEEVFFSKDGLRRGGWGRLCSSTGAG